MPRIVLPNERRRASKDLIEIRNQNVSTQSDLKEFRKRTDDLLKAVEDYKNIEARIQETKTALYQSLVLKVKESELRYLDAYKATIDREILELIGPPEEPDEEGGSKKPKAGGKS